MSTFISPLAQVSPRAQLGEDVYIGPFCLIGDEVTIGDNCRLESHVVIVGKTTIGKGNRFWPNAVIGADPQDYSYRDGAPTSVIIGDENQFREGVTVNRGAEKEDGCTRIGNRNLLMANSHVAHNCRIYDNAMLVNGVLLGGHVHVHDRAIISGNSVVHHFATVGKLAFVSGGCRVPTDVPPFMIAAGSDNPEVKAVNLVGLRRAGISEESIALIRQAYKLLFRDHQPLETVRQHFEEECAGVLPIELVTLLSAMDAQRKGKMGRAREAFRDAPPEGMKKSA
jgi:acyl-[acyl-carrier-protein]--UDP-N-acetylglucosamine O-acyltransferase